MLFVELAHASDDIAATRSRNAKVARLGEVLRALPREELPCGVAYLSGVLPQGRIGLGWAAVRDLDAGPPAAEPSLSIREVDGELGAIKLEHGAGSAGRKRDRLGRVFARATQPERKLLGRLIVGELRQGALAGIMADAIASAFDLPAPAVRRAAMLAGSLVDVAVSARDDGEAGLRRFALTPLSPVLPMLASPADDVDSALERLGRAAFELKLDGARVQVHKVGSEVRVFSRRLHDVTRAVPEIIETVNALPTRELILDGETIALRPDGTPHPFQTTMRRFGRKLDVAKMRSKLPLSTMFFDVLYADGEALIDAPTKNRFEALDDLVPEASRIPRRILDDPQMALAFFDDALDRGHEGLMAKGLDLPYEAGSRGSGWLKLKPAHTLDLVVLAAEWGSGRRKGWLSNLHLGARDPATGGFVMLGKTFKGMTDEILGWQTEQLLSRELGREGHVVHVRPELVAEIALSDVQTSPHYPGGMALRFARLSRYRPDKKPEDADTVEAVRAIHKRSTG